MGNWVLVPWKAVKGISDDLCHALVIFWLKGAPQSPPPLPQGPQQFQMDDLLLHKKLRYNILLRHHLWENWVLVAWKADKGISDNLGHVLVIFWLEWAPNGPPGVPNGHIWTT